MKDESIDKILNKISIEVLKNTESIKSLVTADDFSHFKKENFQRLDKMTDILVRLDQERLFTFDAVQNIEKEIARQRQEIDKIKAQLQIA